jgi:hypothetical protein
VKIKIRPNGTLGQKQTVSGFRLTIISPKKRENEFTGIKAGKDFLRRNVQ